jgi:hypothetical protein
LRVERREIQQCCFSEKFKKVEKLFLKGYPKHVNLDEKMGHFLRSCLSLFKKGYLKMKKRFSQKKFFYFFEFAHIKKKKRNAFLPTLNIPFIQGGYLKKIKVCRT